MSIKGFIFLFLILFLTFSPVTAGIDILHSYVEFPEFYEVNVSDNRAKIIGMVGVPYRGNVTLDSPYVVVDPTGAHLEMDIIYTNIKESDVLNISKYSTNKPIFWYKSSNREGHFYQFSQLNDTFDLSEKFDAKIEKGENKSFEFFNIVFLEPGMYAMSWKLSRDERFKTMFVSIATPLEYEQLTKQAEVLEAEKKSAEASERSAKASEGTANATKSLANKTFALVIVTVALVIVTAITAIIALYEVVWKRRPSIKIVSITNEETNPLKKNENGYIGFIRVFVRNNSYIPLRCRGSVRTDQGTFPLYDWDKYVQRISELPRGLEAFRSFDLSPIGSIELRGEIKSSEDFVTIEISYGKKKPQKREFSLKELEGVG